MLKDSFVLYPYIFYIPDSQSIHYLLTSEIRRRPMLKNLTLLI